MNIPVAETVADLSLNLLPHLAAFVAVVDAGSFTAAAKRTNSDKTVLSRRVSALEKALGVRLLNRTTRSLHVTEAGRRLVDAAREPVNEALAALVRTRAPEQLEGTVRVASAQSLAISVWAPVLVRLRKRHPQLRVQLSTTEYFSDLVREGFELGVRIGRMPDSALIARKLSTWRNLLVASPQWVAAHPEVRNPRDAVDDWLLWSPDARGQTWKFRHRDRDEETEVRVERGAIQLDSSQMLVESARAGLGVVPMPPFCVERELAEGSLVRVLPQWRSVHELGIYGVTPHRAMVPSRVQVVLEAVRERISELQPQWDALSA